MSARFRNAAAALVLLAAPVLAVQPDEILADAALEARARTLSAELRCLVCQNQSIDDSNAPLARDLRLLVRERLVAKDSDAAVLEYVVARYGDFVLLKPPVKSSTLLLWVTPLVVLLGAFWLAFKAGFGRKQTAAGSAGEVALTGDEKKRLEDILKS
ncbi:MAG: cytochrome c-type biogenesis protein [Hyphomicrobium sp.]